MKCAYSRPYYIVPIKTRKAKRKTVKKITRPKSITSRENGKLGGAPPKFIDTNIKKMCELTALGSTNKQIAIALELSVSSVVKYKRHDRFLSAVQASENYAKSKVKRALFQRAIGYTHPEEKIFCNADGQVTRVKTLKHYPPETNAGNIWLNNKEKDWKPGTNTVNVNNTNVNKVENNVLKPEEVTEEHIKEILKNNEILTRNGYLK